MGPITIEGIIGDGAIYHADRKCAPVSAHPCEDHGEWACERCNPDGDYGVLFSTSGLDGSEVCGRCLEPLDEDAFDAYMRQRCDDGECDCPEVSAEGPDDEHTDEACGECGDTLDDDDMARNGRCKRCDPPRPDPDDEYTDGCAICHDDRCRC